MSKEFDELADHLTDLAIAAIEMAVAAERQQWRAWLDRMQKLQELDIEEDFDPAPDKRGVGK